MDSPPLPNLGETTTGPRGPSHGECGQAVGVPWESHSIPDLMYVGIVLSTVLHKKSAMVLQQNHPSKSRGHVVTAGSCTPLPEMLPQELGPRAWDSAPGTSFPG